MWNLHGFWFLTFEIQRGVTNLCRISRVKPFFSGIFKGKVTNLKIQGRGDPPLTPLPPRHTHTHTHKEAFLRVVVIRFFKSCFFILWAQKFLPEMQKVFKRFHFPKYKQSLLLRKYKYFFKNLRTRKFHFLKYYKI